MIRLFLLSLLAIYLNADSKWLSDSNISGNIKYYYIETNKNHLNTQNTSAHSNAIGAQVHYKTPRLHGFRFSTTFMTTHGFLLPDNVESSSLGQDEGKKGLSDKGGYSILGAINLDYTNKYISTWYGRKLVNTPMIGPKPARMLPSTVEGGEFRVFINEKVSASLLVIDKFKQRTASSFSNIIKHALGSDTFSITGSEDGITYTANIKYNTKAIKADIYNMYAPNFMNVFYGDIKYIKDTYSLSAQFVSQAGVGNANTNLAKPTSVTNGKKINANAFGLRAMLKHKESSFNLVYRNILRNKGSYDSIITPWDGNLLYAYSSTTNNLGQSLYGNALTAGGAYVGGTQGLKFGYTQKYNFLGLKSLKTHVALAIYKNSLYREDQEDLKAIVFYDIGKFSLQLKGIWIDNDTYTFKDGTVNQLDSLTQYHAILNYKF